MASHFKTFETERLLLKPTSKDDAEFILRLFNTPKWLKYIGDRNVNTVEEARLYIKMRMIPQMERLGFSNYTILRKPDEEKIGICGLYDRAGLDGLDIGFALLPEFEGNGYAFEATSKLKQVAFDEFDITEIQAITSQDNISSQKLIEKLGLEFIGLVRLPNDTEDLFLYKTFSSD
jgi:RimJ/RimL family protein N-acetyltransferase